MKNLSVLIVEDSISYGIQLERICSEVGFDVIDVVEDSAQALDAIYADHPDLVLMDIDIKGKLTGLEIGKSIVHLDIPILYITSFGDRKSLKAAQESNLADYLVKPVSKEKLINTFKEIIKNNFGIQQDDDVAIITKAKNQKFLFFQVKGEYIRIHINEVAWIASDDNYCMFYLVDGRKFLMRIKISKAEENLHSFGFIRCHRSYIVNQKLIEKFDPKSMEIYISIDQTIPVSRSKKSEILQFVSLTTNNTDSTL